MAWPEGSGPPVSASSSSPPPLSGRGSARPCFFSHAKSACHESCRLGGGPRAWLPVVAWVWLRIPLLPFVHLFVPRKQQRCWLANLSAVSCVISLCARCASLCRRWSAVVGWGPTVNPLCLVCVRQTCDCAAILHVSRGPALRICLCIYLSI